LRLRREEEGICGIEQPPNIGEVYYENVGVCPPELTESSKNGWAVGGEEKSPAHQGGLQLQRKLLLESSEDAASERGGENIRCPYC